MTSQTAPEIKVDVIRELNIILERTNKVEIEAFRTRILDVILIRSVTITYILSVSN